jgi:anti-anti-sigma factor
MDLQIEEREREGIVILDVQGRLSSGADITLLQHLLGLLERGRRHIILNLKNTRELDASGLDTIAFLAMHFKECRGRLVLVEPRPRAINSPAFRDLNNVPDAYQDEADAVNSFFPERNAPRYDILEFVKKQRHETMGIKPENLNPVLF